MAQLQEEVHLLRQMKEMLAKDLEETHGSKSPEVLSATELKVQLAQKEQELARAKEALQGKGCASLFSCAATPKFQEFNLKKKERRSQPFYPEYAVAGGGDRRMVLPGNPPSCPSGAEPGRIGVGNGVWEAFVASQSEFLHGWLEEGAKRAAETQLGRFAKWERVGFEPLGLF